VNKHRVRFRRGLQLEITAAVQKLNRGRTLETYKKKELCEFLPAGGEGDKGHLKTTPFPFQKGLSGSPR